MTRTGRHRAALAAGVVSLLLVGAAVRAGAPPASAFAGPSRFVPGFGLEPQSQIRTALPHAVELRRTGLTVDVTGLWAGPTWTAIDIAVSGNEIGWMMSPLDAVLHDARGNHYRADGFAGGFGDTSAVGTITFARLRAHTRVVVLSASDTPGLGVRLSLVGVKALASPTGVGIAVTRHGVTLAAREESAGPDRFVAVVVLDTPPGTRPGGMEPVDRRLRLVSGAGSAAVLAQVDYSTGGATTYRVAGVVPAPAWRSGSVSVPAVALETGAAVGLSTPVPARGTLVLNRHFAVGPAQIVLHAVKRMPNGDIRLWFAYPGAFRLEGPGMFQMNGRPYQGRTAEFQTDRDGAMVWLQVTPPPGARAVTLTMEGPTLVATGPWRLPLGR